MKIKDVHIMSLCLLILALFCYVTISRIAETDSYNKFGYIEPKPSVSVKEYIAEFIITDKTINTFHNSTPVSVRKSYMLKLSGTNGDAITVYVPANEYDKSEIGKVYKINITERTTTLMEYKYIEE